MRRQAAACFTVAECTLTAYAGWGYQGQMAGEIQGRAVFISYRRDDSEGEAGRLYDDLVRAYGDDSVFMDVAGIEPGLDFRKAIDANVSGCGVLLAMIGPSWASVTDVAGARRLDNPSDFVRLEIASALARGIPVIPVLVHGAKMPPLDQLPEGLTDLRYRNSVELTHARWNSDVALLIGALKSYVSADKSHDQETVHATVPVQLPAPQPEPPGAPHMAAPARKSRLPLILAAIVALLVLGGAFFWWQSWTFGKSTPPPAGSTVAVKANQAAASGGAASAPGSTVPAAAPAPSAPATTVGGVRSGSSPAGKIALLGKWKSVQEPPGGDDLQQITIADFGGQIMVEAWGKCPNRPCAWGSRKATLNGSEAVTESWDLRNTPQETAQQRSASLSILPAGGELQVTVKNTFVRNGQTKVIFNPVQFVRMP